MKRNSSILEFFISESERKSTPNILKFYSWIFVSNREKIIKGNW